MPRTDTVLRVLALAALSLSPGLASALCQPLAASADRETLVADVRLDETNTLLGLDGSRIKSWLPRVDVEAGARAAPFIWAARVDWSVYAAAPGARIGATLLRFERGADGARHLCGIAQYSAGVVEALRAAPGSPLPQPDEETRFYYDDAGRLTGHALRSRGWDGRPNPPASGCLRYDEHGWLAELGASACGDAPRPLARYVHDAAGRLLRTIRYAEGREYAREVVVHDGQGKPAQRYLRPQQDGADGLPALAPPYRTVQTEHPVLALPGPNWKAPALDSYHYDWAIVQPKGDSDVYGAKRDPAAVLASGNSGDGGRFAMTAAQRKRVWDAAGRTPGGVQWMWAPGQILTLVQALPDAAWAACADPANRRADACPAP
ncbi:hypothetical protein ACFWP0_19670 [Achromobacter sp. NPDC058515]|uniref:hypothetical protein n=1 Tax=Achromobacter sp. NPDC058515 TaxID=3346533 RepID=UPI003655B840